MENLFVYGTLRDFGVQKEVIGRAVIGFKDGLKGYRESEIEIEGEKYPVLIPDKTNTIEGLVLSVSPRELRLIDEYETEAYRRIKVALKSGIETWVYVKAENESR